MDAPRVVETSGLPALLVEHLLNSLAGDGTGFFLAELREAPERAVASARELLAAASRATGLSAEELVRRTDIEAADLRGHRVDGALAELRALRLLHRNGFEKIRLLRADNRSKRADILAERGGARHAFDVKCATRELGAGRVFLGPPDLPFPTLLSYLEHLYQDKHPQLESTRREESCSGVGVILALRGALEPGVEGDLARAHARVEAPESFRFALLAARGGGPEQEAFFPSLKQL